MCTRVSRRAVVLALTVVALTGCGRQTAEEVTPTVEMLAVGPDEGALAPRPEYVKAAVDAGGGPATWRRCKRIGVEAVVTIYGQDGSFYLTEQDIDVYPWSRAIQIAAQEPRGTCVSLLAEGQYRLIEGDHSLDVSGLGVSHRDYAEAVLEIMTTPARVLARDVALTRRPEPMRTAGQWYHLMEATYAPTERVSKEKGRTTVVVVEPYWAQGIYYQNRDRSLIDTIWLANAAKGRSILVRGYDYTPVEDGGVLVPTKVEIFQADSQATPGRRLVQIDVK